MNDFALSLDLKRRLGNATMALSEVVLNDLQSCFFSRHSETVVHVNTRQNAPGPGWSKRE